MIKLGAKQLRTTKSSDKQKKTLKKNPIYIICDNILDTYNVGSIFRLADAVAAQKVYLCGITETPPNTRIKKASINTTEWVSWEYFSSTLEALREVKTQNPEIKIVAIEQSTNSIPFNKVDYALPIALIVSNETTGASKEVLNQADMIVEMPMYGVNKDRKSVV